MTIVRVHAHPESSFVVSGVKGMFGTTQGEIDMMIAEGKGLANLFLKSLPSATIKEMYFIFGEALRGEFALVEEVDKSIAFIEVKS